MKSLWRDADAEAMVARYADDGIGRDLALRVYTTRLLGGEPRLVLHGGGNTSVKPVAPDPRGGGAEVMCGKGSGRDRGAMGRAGRPPSADPPGDAGPRVRAGAVDERGVGDKERGHGPIIREARPSVKRHGNESCSRCV